MGIFCEIILHKPEDGAFTSGGTIQGIIKYAIDQETSFKRITVSLKGKGHLSMEYEDNKQRHEFVNSEEYINETNVVHDENKAPEPLAIGSYETEFCLKLPEKIPSTLHYSKRSRRYFVRCNIAYNIKIKFEKVGVLAFSKTFKKEITVVSNIITPRLPNVPTVCKEQKTLTQWFSNKKSTVYIKATIKKSVLKPGDNIELDYEVTNATNVIVKSVETKLVEMYNFTSIVGRGDTVYKDVKNTDSKTGTIGCGETKSMSIEIRIPSDLNSLDYSKMVSRNYVVHIIAGLPFPHRDAVLEIPVQIGKVDVQTEHADAPPSYWEAMSEEVTGKDDKRDEEVAS